MTKTVYTTEQAKAKLTELGYIFDAKQSVWVTADGAIGGRLEWVPDYTNPNDFNAGTSFSLRSPFGPVTAIELS